MARERGCLYTRNPNDSRFLARPRREVNDRRHGSVRVFSSGNSSFGTQCVVSTTWDDIRATGRLRTAASRGHTSLSSRAKGMQSKLLPIFGVLLLFATFAQGQAPVAPAPPPAIQFDEMKPFAQWPDGDEFVLTFPTVIPTAQPENNVVPIHILLPHDKAGPFPVVVILHYWGALNRNVERAMGLALNRRGIAAVLMTLPYHLERTPAGSRSGEMAIQADPALLNVTILQSLQDTRRAIDYVESRPEFDHNRIGIGGLSLGAIVTALVYGVDPRVSHAAFVLGGVDIAHILWYSSRVVAQREELRQKGFTEEKLREDLAALEPGTFLKARPGTDALIVAAHYDTVIPEKSTQELIDDIQHPEVSWLNTGHFGGAFVQNRLLAEVADYFDTAFRNQPFAAQPNLGAPTIRLGVQFNFDTGMDLAFGADVWTAGKEREYSATALLTPRGLRLFLGRRVGRQISAGGVLDARGVSLGVLWSTVL